MTPTNPTDAQMKLAGRCATEAYKMAEDDRTTLHGYAVQSAMLAIQATEARAQGLVDALEAMLHAVCHETGFANAVRNDSGVAYPWEPLDIVEASARQALATWRRT